MEQKSCKPKSSKNFKFVYLTNRITKSQNLYYCSYYLTIQKIFDSDYAHHPIDFKVKSCRRKHISKVPDLMLCLELVSKNVKSLLHFFL